MWQAVPAGCSLLPASHPRCHIPAAFFGHPTFYTRLILISCVPPCCRHPTTLTGLTRQYSGAHTLTRTHTRIQHTYNTHIHFHSLATMSARHLPTGRDVPCDDHRMDSGRRPPQVWVCSPLPLHFGFTIPPSRRQSNFAPGVQGMVWCDQREADCCTLTLPRPLAHYRTHTHATTRASFMQCCSAASRRRARPRLATIS